MPFTNPYIKKIASLTDFIIQPNGNNIENTALDIKFDNLQNIVLDIGCGAGNFLTRMAAANLNFNFIGIELKYKRLFKAAQKIIKNGINNAKLIRTRAEDINFFFEDGSISAIFINFPDPWPKKRHQKNRLINKEYTKSLMKLLKKDGLLFFQTDHADYFNQAVEILKNAGFKNFTTENLNQLNLKITDEKNQVFLSEFGSLFLHQNKEHYRLMLKN